MRTIGSVSYLNARPLIDGLDADPGLRMIADVPSRLLPKLLNGSSDVALIPIIDYQNAPEDLCIVPSGAIGSDGETLTVRMFGSRPVKELENVAVDGDSKTSVALLKLIFNDVYGTNPNLFPVYHRPHPAKLPAGADAILLIGDKVVNSAPELPFQLDLGEAWKRLTGMPFVFAAWMARPAMDLGDLPQRLVRRRDLNLRRIPKIAATHAVAAGWPIPLAEDYLGRLLRYDFGQRELKAVATFWERCHQLGIIEKLRPLSLYRER